MVVAMIVGGGITVAANIFSLTGLRASSMQKQIETLAEENRAVEIKATSLKSLQSIKSSAAAQEELIQVQDLKHITFTGTARQDSVSSN